MESRTCLISLLVATLFISLAIASPHPHQPSDSVKSNEVGNSKPSAAFVPLVRKARQYYPGGGYGGYGGGFPGVGIGTSNANAAAIASSSSVGGGGGFGGFPGSGTSFSAANAQSASNSFGTGGFGK